MASIELMTKAAVKFAGMPKEGQDTAEILLCGMKLMYDALKDKLPPEPGPPEKKPA